MDVSGIQSIKKLGSPWNYRLECDLRKLHEHNKISKKLGLLGDLSPYEWHQIRDHFGQRCALSFSFDISLEHFIATSTGHVGTTKGNCYPLDINLNLSKGDTNPFFWAEKNKDTIEYALFEELVAYLADQNGLTVEEYKDFVYWCYGNPRTPCEAIRDHRPSLQIWKEEYIRQKQRDQAIEVLAYQRNVTPEAFVADVLDTYSLKR